MSLSIVASSAFYHNFFLRHRDAEAITDRCRA
ncbi:hypothetical protein PENNAL_c0252G03553 [Penicillium nalgiovense]|uniref:Uncharacterized protein n=1 Tax=Penicillium nalgiovense TaxID=60175 RepID=A0A1V6WJA4_PENNA|nr:hypothetical protein PENNAL_c0252G03553 [Penicillium nalgiovense]